MNSFLIDSLGWTLVHFIWQGALIGAAVALVLAGMDRATPQQRYMVACLGLLACLLWPALDLAGRLDVASASGGGAGVLRLPNHPGQAGVLGWHMNWLVGAWSACALALALRLAAGLLWLHRADRAARADAHWDRMARQMAQRFGITRSVRVRVVEHLDSPLTAGWLRPVVLLPAALVSGMPPELLNALLAHEMAHVRRFDYLVNVAQSVIEMLLFYHPAVWWISRRIRIERELAADALAAQALGEGRILASALSELAHWQSAPHLAVAANGGELLGRVRALVRPQHQALNWKAALPVLAIAVAGLSLAACAADQAVNQPLNTPAVVDFNSCAKPVWPAESLKEQQTGTVTMRFSVAPDGSVVKGKVHTSSGHPLLDQAALEGIGKCTFKPGMRNGKPIMSTMMMQYVWTLQ